MRSQAVRSEHTQEQTARSEIQKLLAADIQPNSYDSILHIKSRSGIHDSEKIIRSSLKRPRRKLLPLCRAYGETGCDYCCRACRRSLWRSIRRNSRKIPEPTPSFGDFNGVLLTLTTTAGQFWWTAMASIFTRVRNISWPKNTNRNLVRRIKK